MENFNANEWFVENDKSEEKIQYEFDDSKTDMKLQKTMKYIGFAINIVVLLTSIVALFVMIFGYGYYYGIMSFICVIGILLTSFINVLITSLIKKNPFFITSIISSFILLVISIMIMLLNIL